MDDHWSKTLSNETKTLLGLPSTATPDEAFLKIMFGAGKYAYAITLCDPENNPMQGLTIDGVSDINGNPCVTNANGQAIGVSTNSTVTLSVTSPYIDLNSLTQTVNSSAILTKVNLNLSEQYAKNTVNRINTSMTNVRFSYRIQKVDFCAVGGGGGGSTAGSRFPNGGGGGFVENLLDITPANDIFDFTIGSGGIGVHEDSSGGGGGVSKIIKNSSELLSAKGGNGGSAYNSGSDSKYGQGNGTGGGGNAGLHGTDGTGYIFEDTNLGLAGGGGGGCGTTSSIIAPGSGGAPYGGNGGYRANGSNARGPGGGGGGGGYNVTAYYGGTGGAGTVYFRMR